MKVNRTLSKKMAKTAMVISIALLGIAVIISFVSFSNQTAPILIDGLIALSALYLSLSLLYLTRNPFIYLALIGFASLIIYSFLFYLTMIFSMPVKIGSNMLLYVQPYPQTILALLFGICILGFIPIMYLLKYFDKKGNFVD
jgi:hypothetical protein